MKRRRLTVSYVPAETRSSRLPRRSPAPMPFLRLKGRWLGQAGFAIGVPVQVTVAPGRLVLEALDDEPGC